MKFHQKETDKYNVRYVTPGKSDRSAMPLGNGRVGISLWVEHDGDMQFYIGHTDAQSEVDRNMKLGKVFLNLDPNPFTSGCEFSQELILREGCVAIKVKSLENSVHMRVFVDVETDTVYADIHSEIPIKASARFLNWRTLNRAPWSDPNTESSTGFLAVNETADVVESREGGCLFYHKNGPTCVPITAKIEAMSDYMDKIVDTLENRTFGGFLTLSGALEDLAETPQKMIFSKVQAPVKSGVTTTRKQADIYTLSSNESMRNWNLKASIFCEQEANTEELMKRTIAEHKRLPDVEAAATRTAAFWDDYFGKSYIFVIGDGEEAAPVSEEIAKVCLEPQDAAATPSKVTQSYLLTKFMFACTGKGNIPINFNGMIFNLMPGLDRHLSFDGFCQTFAAQPAGQPDLEINPDEKGWENCINLWQNVRLPYAAMLARGEFDSVKQLFRYYRNFWQINRVKAKVYYDAEGQYNTEMTNTFGLQPLSVYGSDRTGLKDGYSINRWGGAIDISPGLELCFMILDYFNYSRDTEFLKTDFLPYAEDLLHFIETRFKERVDGKIELTKLQSVETYFDTTNPIPVVAGMHAVTDSVLSLPAELVYNRAFFEKFKELIPEMPTELDENGNSILAPAKQYENMRMNVESPVLYPVYPFRMFTHYQGDMKQIRDTYEHNLKLSDCFRPHVHGWAVGTAGYSGWQYLGMVAALLGMTRETEEILVNNCALKNPGNRFPAMWGPIYDAVPDSDHGANITNTLQLMALQAEGDEMYLLPAWPEKWDVRFKLFAGNNTTVECSYENGKLQEIIVTPKERMKDLVIPCGTVGRR